MHFRTAHDLERTGRWRDAVEELIRLSVARPLLWPMAALEQDRLLRLHGGAGARLNYARHGLSADSKRWFDSQGWTLPPELFRNPPKEAVDAIHDAQSIEKKHGLPQALSWAFARARGLEIESLNLMLARHFTRDDALWVRFVNRYLAPLGLAIRLTDEPGRSRFERLAPVATGPVVDAGPLVSVLMPVHNAQATLRQAADSILGQTWRRLELILIDDASTDGSWALCQAIAQADARVKLHRNVVNVGPYVSKNVGLGSVQGEYLTCHDADDWAFPNRIEHQVALLQRAGGAQQATAGRMLRMDASGEPTRIARIGPLSDDGCSRLSFVSTMFATDHFRQHLGAWDSVRVGGDSELIERADKVPGGVLYDRGMLMLALDQPGSLTRDPVLGLAEFAPGSLRTQYQSAWRKWHARLTPPPALSARPDRRPFNAPKELVVTVEALLQVHGELEATPQWAAAEPSCASDSVATPAQPAQPADRPAPDEAPARAHSHKQVLADAHAMAQAGRYEAALDHATRHLPPELLHTAQLLQANAAVAAGDYGAWVRHVNAYLQAYGIAPITLAPGSSLLNRLSADELPSVEQGPLISVIMPAWNAQDTVEAAARSILKQTWRNLELFIVDDASTDNTWSVLEQLAASDSRVRIQRNAENVGPYISKNAALMRARGVYVTGHDADDWAHPQRIEHHLRFMMDREVPLLASYSYMLRVSGDGAFNRLQKINDYSPDGAARLSMISTIYNREMLGSTLGFWDSVRFGADSEMISRARKLLGPRLQPAPLLGMICLDLEGGLTNHPEHGITANNGRMSLDRTAYKKRSDAWHGAASGKQLFMPFPCRRRPFEAPKSMLNDSAVLESVVKAYYNGYGTPFRSAIEVFDVCIVTDLEFQGGNASSTMEEVQFLQKNGHSVALIHCAIDRRMKTQVKDRYSKLKRFTYDASSIGTARCEELIVRNPSVACSSSFQTLRTRIEAKRTHFVVNNSNLRIDGTSVYSIGELARIARETKAAHVELCPISPIMRRQLIEGGALEGQGILLSATDWNPTFDFATHRAEPRPWHDGQIVIGRHGRDGPEKWLESADLLRMAYPSGKGFKVKILGGADTAIKILGSLPENWTVLAFGAMDPMRFLDGLDVFAYYPNTGLQEGFGRTVVEALMRGVVCLLPLNFEETFGDLAIYARPQDVEQVCKRLAETPDLRMEFVRCTSSIAAGKFSNDVIYDRLQIARPPGSKPRRDDATALTKGLAAYKRWVETGSEGENA